MIRFRPVGAGLLGCLLLGATRLPAQSPAALPDTVRGVVYDSLGGEPLADAFVVAAPSGVTTTTDSLGRFMLVSEGAVASLTAYHPVLDRTGLGALGAARPTGRDRWRDAQLTTPSLGTLWPRLCDSRRPQGVRSVIVTGTARLADNRTRVAGAQVLVQWVPTMPSRRDDPYVTVDVLTDSLGNYVACGVEAFVDLSLLALSTEAQSGVIAVPSMTHPLRRVDLVLQHTDAEDRRVALRGRVLDRESRPLANAWVSIDGRDSAVATGTDGRFTLDSVPPGSRMLWVRAIGYTPVAEAVDVLESDNPALTIPVERVVELEGVRVTERAVVRRERSEFDLRKRAGIGRYVDSADIARAPILRTVLSGVMRGVTVTGFEKKSNTNEFDIWGRGGCRATVFWDGILATMEDVNRIPKEDIVSVEYYTTTALAPARFIMVARNDCAVVLFWTKNGLRP